MADAEADAVSVKRYGETSAVVFGRSMYTLLGRLIVTISAME